MNVKVSAKVVPQFLLKLINFINFINKHNILYKLQFGFRHKYNTSLALIYLIDKIITAISKGEIVLGVFIDLKKAFDTVNHLNFNE
jgi:hypothetical protein